MTNAPHSKRPLIIRCPFCYKAQGDIRIDLYALSQWQPPPSAEPRNIDIARVPGQPVIQFCRGDVIVDRPCPHMLAFYIDIFERTDAGIVRETEWSLGWDNPWLDVQDETASLRQDVEILLFNEDLKDHIDYPPPKALFSDRWISKVLGRENGRTLTATGRVISALEPERLLNDMLAALRATQPSRPVTDDHTPAMDRPAAGPSIAGGQENQSFEGSGRSRRA